MQNNAEEPKTTQKKRGQSKEHLAEISKIGNETKKKMGAITAYEKAQKRKEIDEKFAMIQAEISKSTQKDIDEVPEPPPQPEPPVVKKTSQKPKKVVEIVEEVEDDQETSDEEEEIVVKRIIKKKPPPMVSRNDDRFIQKSNIEMLKNRFNEDVRKRLMSSLFD